MLLSLYELGVNNCIASRKHLQLSRASTLLKSTGLTRTFINGRFRVASARAAVFLNGDRS